MRNKINIKDIDFEFPKFTNKDKFKLLDKILRNLNNNQITNNISTCSVRKDKKVNKKLNEICDFEDNHVNKIINYITNDDILIVLDTEFQTFEIKDKKRDYVRELAMIIFIKHTNYDKDLEPALNVKWTHLADIFVNFELLINKDEKFTNKNISFIDKNYASVTDNTKDIIHKLFHQINTVEDNFNVIKETDKIIKDFTNDILIDFDAFENSIEDFRSNKKLYNNLKFSNSNKLDEKILEKNIQVYQDDIFVKNRSFINNYQEKDFLSDLNKLFNQDVTVIVKGDGDIVSLKNSNSFYNNNHFGIRHIIDIARQNNYYHSLNIGSAKLENTYKFLRYGLNFKNEQIKKPFYTNNLINSQVTNYLENTFPDKFIGNNLTFHNPLDDCIATFFIMIMLSANTHSSILSNMVNHEKIKKRKDKEKYFNLNIIDKINNNIDDLNDTLENNTFTNYVKNLLDFDNTTDSDSSELLFNFK